MIQDPKVVAEAHERIKDHIRETPLLSSNLLNEYLGHEIFFKAEGFQEIGAFKARGALNALLCLKEKNELPEHVVAFSSGNHAQAVAWAASILKIKATICVPSNISSLKLEATKSRGAEVELCETRMDAEKAVEKYVSVGAYFLHPYDNDMVIAGQGTAAYEVLKEGMKPDAIFASVGGGGWLSGTYLATRLLSPESKVIGAEPLNANDAARSLRDGEIFSFEDSPNTIADGAATLRISERTFAHLKELDAFYEISEEDIIYWTQWLSHLLKITVEPSSAMAMAAAHQYLKTQNSKQKLLVMLSGANVSKEKHELIWAEDFLGKIP